MLYFYEEYEKKKKLFRRLYKIQKARNERFRISLALRKSAKTAVEQNLNNCSSKKLRKNVLGGG